MTAHYTGIFWGRLPSKIYLRMSTCHFPTDVKRVHYELDIPIFVPRPNKQKNFFDGRRNNMSNGRTTQKSAYNLIGLLWASQHRVSICIARDNCGHSYPASLAKMGVTFSRKNLFWWKERRQNGLFALFWLTRNIRCAKLKEKITFVHNDSFHIQNFFAFWSIKFLASRKFEKTNTTKASSFSFCLDSPRGDFRRRS